ncbi:MAG: hypothetical protein PHD54_16425 [Desulfuromonadaceae bacterium]|nr:hypothetical protein [Desulfuromonadaceae bacterium]
MGDGPTLPQKIFSVIFLLAALTAFIWQARVMWLQDIKKIIRTEESEKVVKPDETQHIDVRT